MTAEILSYSRTKGLFAGINLSGGVVRPDNDDNRDLYGKNIVPRTLSSYSYCAELTAISFSRN